ncbi:tRNA lysidine(34) synthetase TilS [Acerihabitans arboris]|uniref:tRNA(Ile)-lysidine synthase n=1 Tax=Acerihabitans arboris TaxID=2691583 RepID=A0A845SQD6_9GAMM|nr:tRNA lysidine(34) synthetase TilS [Acerihabitans arboris]NDL65572.1 tRNA lysidine(34) synthetase TilS [Acerihabitans arboris]
MKHKPGDPQTRRDSVAGLADASGALCRHIALRLGRRRAALVALSGGLDSTVLLDALACLRSQQIPDLALRAVYIHHGLSAHADEWALHCQALCLRLRVPFLRIDVRVDAADGGIEAAARGARYRALAQTLLPGETLLTAQHQDDQGETLLLALKRGSGPAGLSSMAAASPFHGHELLRPLLDIGRARLRDYAESRCLSWIEDESNQDERFDRNFLRLRIIPLLKRRWPHFSQAAARSARLCAEQETLLDELLGETLHQLTAADNSLDLAPMLTMSAVRRGAVLRRWLASAEIAMPSREQLDRIWTEVAQSRRDAEPSLRLGERQIRRYRQRLFILPLWPSLRERVLTWEDTGRPLSLPEDLGMLRQGAGGAPVRRPQADERVSVRFTAAGILHIVGRRHGRSIKKLWQELGIAPWQRERTPLVYYNEQLIAAPGIFITREGEAKEGETGLFLQWVRQAGDMGQMLTDRRYGNDANGK